MRPQLDTPNATRIAQFAEKISDALTSNRIWVLLVYSVVYIAITCSLAAVKLLWNDELFTLYFCKISSLSGTWSALLTGADQIPPLFIFFTRASIAIFGENDVGIRLPEILGFLVMSLSLFYIVSRRSSALFGFVAMLFPLITSAYDYAYEARPYGVVLGFAGLSLLCWLSVAEGEPRKWWLAGLTLSLAGAVCSHYFAIFLFLPLVMGELTRSISLRRVEPGVWIAFGCSLIPLTVFLPLIRAAHSYAGTFWAKPTWKNFGTFYDFLLSSASLPALLVLVLLAFYSLKLSNPESKLNESENPNVKPYEFAVILTFVAFPFIGLIVGKFLLGVYADRYVLPTVIGISMLLGLTSYRFTRQPAIVSIILIAVFFCSFLVKESREYIRQVSHRKTWSAICDSLEKDARSGLPLIGWHSNTVVELEHYCSQDTASKLIYLADPKAALQYIGQNTVDRGLLDLRTWFPVKVEPYETFTSSHNEFLIFGFLESPDWNWLLSKLLSDGSHVELKSRYRDDFLVFRVTRNR